MQSTTIARFASLASLSLLALVLLGGCGHHYRQAKADAFAAKVADRCLEASRAAQPQVIVIPAGGAPVAVPAPAPIPAPLEP